MNSRQCFSAHFARLLLVAFTLLASLTSFAQSSEVNDTLITTQKGRLLRFDADSDRGFNYPYLVYIPAGMSLRDSLFLLVEPNNTGFWNDTMAVHEQAAISIAQKSSVGNAVAKTLQIPLLVPIFPRPARDSLTYTHALDRDAIRLRQGPMQRLDRQLFAMIDDAARQLAEQGIFLKKKVLLNGFSASGTFVNRLTFIYPERVAATACGGINALPMQPVASLNNIALPYPLGLADFPVHFGKIPDLVTYRQIPQLLYMGENDQNDAVLFDDAYNDAERAIVYAVIGKTMLPGRWAKGMAVYKAAGTNATFRLYPGMGHGTNSQMNAEVAQFFRNVIGNTP